LAAAILKIRVALHRPSWHIGSDAPDAGSDDRIKAMQQGLTKLGKAKRREAQLQWLAEGRPRRPGLRQLRPQDLPPDVTAESGYDHRGHCYLFSHKQLGELGRIVLIQVREQEMLMQAELYQGHDKPESPVAKKRKAVFEQVVATVNAAFEESFQDHHDG
jgi:hypothetical protein